MDSDPTVRWALLREGRDADLRPDLQDVARRVRQRVGRKRLRAALIGLGGAVVVIGVALLALGPLGSSPGPPPNGARQKTGLPEGKLLLGETLLSPGGREPVAMDIAWSISPDGTRILGTDLVQGPGSLSRPAELVMVDLGSGRQSVLVRVGTREWLGPVEWSPNGQSIAYQRSICPVGPGKTLCPAQTVDTLCLFEVESGRGRCLSGLRQVRSFDWSPDGRDLVIDAAGPVQVVDPATGSTSALLPPGGTDSVRRALEEAGLGHAIQFVRPLWSASGRYVGALANLRGGSAAYVPVVVDAGGRLVAMGRPSTEFQPGFGWSPARDVLAYAKGKAPYTTTGVYVLDAETGEDRLLLDTTPKTTAQPLFDVASLAWSPSGRWLAISPSARGALIIDTAGEESPVEVAGGEVKGWTR